MITRPSQMPGVERFDGLAYDIQEARAVIAEARMWRVAVWAERGAWAGFVLSLTLWAWLAFA
jgi:hypothetical protein